MSDEHIEHPSHYNQGKIEVIDFIIDQKMEYLIANVCKYICRAKFKGKELEDLKKARWFLNKKIGLLEAEEKEKRDKLGDSLV